MKLNPEWEVKIWDQLKCENCGRMRVNTCINGYHLCEKCEWCLELKRRISDEEMEIEE
jgi:ribosomal protein L37AE/L43A